MTLKTEEIEAALIDDVCSRVREKLRDDEAPQVEEFVRQYYRRVPPEDLVGRSELDVYGAALAQWNFMCRRAPGEAKVRVYNSQFEQHGWQSPPRSSRSSATTCRSSWTRSAWRSAATATASTCSSTR
jgi:glutamate dehydrogenase